MTVKTASSPLLLLLSLLPNTALAQAECGDDADCDRGFECRVVGQTGCATPDCAPGESCPEQPTCKPEEIRACVPGQCESNADCAEGMQCHPYEVTSCGDHPTCAPGETCPEPDPLDCEPATESQCVPVWALPCVESSDCGAGFDCVERESCQCSGGGADPGVADAGSSIAPDLDERECGCTPSGEFYCKVRAAECSTNTDCPAEWKCEAASVTCSGGSGGSTGGGEMSEPPKRIDAGLAVGAQAAECEPDVSAMTCVPPGYYPYIEAMGGDGQGDAGGEVGGEEPTEGGVTPPTADAGDDGDHATTDAGEEPGPNYDGDSDVRGSDAAEGNGCECALPGQRGTAPRSGVFGLTLAGFLGLGLTRRSNNTRKRST